MVELTYVESKLLQGEAELARIEVELNSAITGRVIAAHREYAIVRPKRSGWHYRVVDPPSDTVVCNFHPYWMRRGGRLSSAPGGSVVLSTRPFRTRAWRFTTEDGHRIDASVGPPRGAIELRSDPSGEVRRATVVHTGDPPVVTLRSEDLMSLLPDAVVTLAFGCWLIVQYESLPMLPMTGGGG
jgi:hypothetical protein